MNDFPQHNDEYGFLVADQQDMPGALHAKHQRAGIAHPDAENESDDGPRASHAQNLSSTQKTTLLGLISLHYDVRAVQKALALLEGFPPIGDYTIRRYRARLDSGAIRLADKERMKALRTGLARKETRLAQLTAMHEELAALPIVTTVITTGEDGQIKEVRIPRLDIIRGRREVLKQISVELGQWMQPLPPLDPDGPPTGAVVSDEAQRELQDVINTLTAERLAMQATLQVVQRPVTVSPETPTQ